MFLQLIITTQALINQTGQNAIAHTRKVQNVLIIEKLISLPVHFFLTNNNKKQCYNYVKLYWKMNVVCKRVSILIQGLSKPEHNTVAAKYHHYASIMPDTLDIALCQKLCQHNLANPRSVILEKIISVN